MSKKSATKNESKNAYVEYKCEGEQYNYSGRIYLEHSNTFGKVTSVPVSVTIDDLITIKGCHYKYTDKNAWVEFPEYKSGDEYKSFFYFAEGMNNDLTAIANAIGKAVNKTA